MDSSTSTPAKKKFNRRNVIAAVGAALLSVGLAAAVGMANPVGADFSASGAGSANIKAATVSVDLADNHGSENFALKFGNVAPGDVVTDVVYIKNTGSIPANVAITGWAGDPALGVPNVDYNQLKIGIQDYKALTPSTQFQTADLGSLAPGESRAYTFQVGLDQAAGNSWQGVELGGTITVTLTQQ